MMPAPRSSDPEATALFDLLSAHRITATIYAAVRLGIPDLLAEGVQTSPDLAGRSGADPASVKRLMRGLVAIGVCRQATDDHFELTAMGGYLTSSAERSLKPFALFEGSMIYQSWAGLVDSIRTGKTGSELA